VALASMACGNPDNMAIPAERHPGVVGARRIDSLIDMCAVADARGVVRKFASRSNGSFLSIRVC
jgi:hypothetical protein